MAEENKDITEESNDEMENWIYYKHEPKTEENVDMNTFTDATNQQLIYLDYSLIDGQEEKFHHKDCNKDNIMSSDVQHQDNSNQQEQHPEPINYRADDATEHSLLLRETIDENGELVEDYYCQQCNLSCDNVESFLNAHPGMEMLNECSSNEEDATQQNGETETDVSKNKLCDLVEDIDEEENVEDATITDIKPGNIQYDDSSQEKETNDNSVETDKEHYFCYDCQRVFADLIAAENHDCGNDSQTTDNLIEVDSKMVLDNKSVYRCDLCDKDYHSLRSFTNHQRWHKKSELLLGHSKTLQAETAICEVCNTVFACEKNLKLHMKMHKKQTSKTIQDALPVGAQEEYNDLSQFFCEICNKSFDQNLLAIHKNMHKNVEEYSCGKCNKKFENLPSYEIHMQMHMDTSKKAKTTTKTNYETILPDEEPSTSGQVVTAGAKRKHACQYCGKEFLRPYEKVKHERVHTGEKPYECEVCGKTFRVSYSLTLHLRTHTDIRPYVCTTCNKRFKQQSVYVHHLKIHDSECAYKCDVCGKSFRTSVQLGGHKNIHSKPYNCTECNRPFASLYAVKTHMKTHNKCHKSNKNLKNLCSICGASYARVFALSLHIKEQHGIDVDPIELSTGSANMQKKIQSAVTLATGNQDYKYRNVDDRQNVESNEINDDEDDDVYVNKVEDEESITKTLPNHVYIDETEAATQTILNTDEITVDQFAVEEVITDWVGK